MLAGLITSSIDTILKQCGTGPFPSSDEPFSLESEAVRMDPIIQAHSGLAVSAAAQLIAALRPPPLALSIHSVTVRH